MREQIEQLRHTTLRGFEPEAHPASAFLQLLKQGGCVDVVVG